MTTRPATQTDALGTRREPDWPNYIRDFLYAVYPDFGAAALACFDEKKCLQDATDLINELRAKHSRLVEALRQSQEPTARRIAECLNACAQMDDPAKGIAETGALLNRVCAENSRLRGALASFCEAFDNRGETTSLKEWNSRMKLAYADAQEALAGREPYSDPKMKP